MAEGKEDRWTGKHRWIVIVGNATVEYRPRVCIRLFNGPAVKPMNDACDRTSNGVKVPARVLDPVGVNGRLPVYARDTL